MPANPRSRGANSVLWQGWMTKCGQSNKRWRKRYFIAREGGDLRYYKDESAQQEKGMIPMQSAAAVCTYAPKKVGGKTRLVLVTMDRVWLMAFENNDEAESLLPVMGRFTHVAHELCGNWVQTVASMRSTHWKKQFASLLSTGHIIVFEDAKLNAVADSFPPEFRVRDSKHPACEMPQSALDLLYHNRTLVLCMDSGVADDAPAPRKYSKWLQQLNSVQLGEGESAAPGDAAAAAPAAGAAAPAAEAPAPAADSSQPAPSTPTPTPNASRRAAASTPSLSDADAHDAAERAKRSGAHSSFHSDSAAALADRAVYDYDGTIVRGAAAAAAALNERLNGGSGVRCQAGPEVMRSGETRALVSVGRGLGSGKVKLGERIEWGEDGHAVRVTHVTNPPADFMDDRTARVVEANPFADMHAQNERCHEHLVSCWSNGDAASVGDLLHHDARLSDEFGSEVPLRRAVVAHLEARFREAGRVAQGVEGRIHVLRSGETRCIVRVADGRVGEAITWRDGLVATWTRTPEPDARFLDDDTSEGDVAYSHASSLRATAPFLTEKPASFAPAHMHVQRVDVSGAPPCRFSLDLGAARDTWASPQATGSLADAGAVSWAVDQRFDVPAFGGVLRVVVWEHDTFASKVLGTLSIDLDPLDHSEADVAVPFTVPLRYGPMQLSITCRLFDPEKEWHTNELHERDIASPMSCAYLAYLAQKALASVMESDDEAD